MKGSDDPGRADAELVGRVIDGRYRIVELLAVGAMARIYLAEQKGMPQRLALKVLGPDIARHKTATARFHREAKAASRLHHPGIVSIYDWGVDGDVPYIAMELIEGRDLFELLDREGPLAQDRAVRLAIRICDALQSAHDVGVIHRDLKPENVMVLPQEPNGDEPVKVLDFGIAKLLAPRRAEEFSDETHPQVLTKVGSAVGTPSHMAPEQARGVNVDGRADVYALGVLLYEMVTKHLPFEGDNPIVVAVRQVREPPPAPSTYLPTIHPDLERIILSALEKDPESRWSSARAFAAALTHVLSDLDPDDESTRRIDAPDTDEEEDLPTREQDLRSVQELLRHRIPVRTARGTVLLEDEPSTDEPDTLSLTDRSELTTLNRLLEKSEQAAVQTLPSAGDDEDESPTIRRETSSQDQIERVIHEARREAEQRALAEARAEERTVADRPMVFDEPTDESGVATPQFDRMGELPRTFRGEVRPLRRLTSVTTTSSLPPPPPRPLPADRTPSRELDSLSRTLPRRRPVVPVVLLLLTLLVATSLVWFAFAGVPELPELRDLGRLLRW